LLKKWEEKRKKRGKMPAKRGISCFVGLIFSIFFPEKTFGILGVVKKNAVRGMFPKMMKRGDFGAILA
jgi:hypothetical protein